MQTNSNYEPRKANLVKVKWNMIRKKAGKNHKEKKA